MVAPRSRLPQEIWRPCIVAPAYEVSDLANVRRKGSAVPLATYRQKSGYRTVVMSMGGKMICRGLHVVVAEAHLVGGPIPPGLEVRHRVAATVSDDNSAGNLLVGTHAENVRDALLAGGYAHGVRHYRAPLTDELVEEARRRARAGEHLVRIAADFADRGIPAGVTAVASAVHGRTANAFPPAVASRFDRALDSASYLPARVLVEWWCG